MRRFALVIPVMTVMWVFGGCIITDTGDPGGTPCNSDGQCSSGACFQVTCQNSNATPQVCGGASCVMHACIGDQVCVDVASNESYCVPNSVCGGGGGNTDCDNACAYIYGTCNLSLVDNNSNIMTETECVQACDALNRVNMEQCAQAAACDTTATPSCFQ
ncbi:MAG: hypothetical protein KAI47_24485 [Deltaproteobacteria bacterium]|nr:hypothetical protein [Deltaproteobacteria bacterium]